MTEQESWNKVNQYKLLCQLFAVASCEFSRRDKISVDERREACEMLKPYIRDVLMHVDAAITIFTMEKISGYTKV